MAPLPLPSASTISATAISGIHVVKLSGYSHAKQLLGTGECVESALFKAAGYSWRVKVFPNGALEECGPGSIALFLALAGGKSKADVRAMLQFSLVRHGSKLPASAPDSGRVTETPVTFDRVERDWGFEDEGLGEKLEDPEYLKDDAILIRCDITVLNDPTVERRDLEALDTLQEDKTPPAMTRPSASTIAVTASAGCHVLKVSGYSRTKLLTGNGNHIKSAEFKEAGHKWRIRCYPDGAHEETAGHVALYLELAGESTDVHAKFQFNLVPHGQLTSAPHSGRVISDRVIFGSKCADNCFGFKDFMARGELEKSEYLKDDCLYIRCDIIALNKPVVKLHDPDTLLELLCCCSDDLCKNIHAPDKMEDEAYGKPRRCLGLTEMLLSCLPIPMKPSQDPLFHTEYSRL
ncbi:unnamed protein product [Urochloa decumbens]|uniref:MATH domain-containing protein n=1 Tax=Urochloa decumbens TaxID=240449 RepID=A0ABC9D0L5_9POAL